MLAATTIQKSYNNLKMTYRRRIDELTSKMTNKFVYPAGYQQ